MDIASPALLHSTLYAYDYAYMQAPDVIMSKQNRMNNRYNCCGACTLVNVLVQATYPGSYT